MAFLDQQISQLNKNSQMSKKQEAEQLDKDDEKGDLAFDDLAIDFEKAMKTGGK